MGFVPIFYFRTFLRCYLKASKGLTELLDPVVTGMGYELLGREVGET